MTGGPFHGVSHGKLLSTLTGRAAFQKTQRALRSHPLSWTHYSTFIGSEMQRGRRGTMLSHSSLCFFLPLLSCLPLSVRGQVCHTTGAQPQTVNADKINFLMLIPVGTKHTERKSSSPVPCKTGRVSTPPFLLSQ